VGFEPTIPAFERTKTVHALDRAVTVIGGDVQKMNIKTMEECRCARNFVAVLEKADILPDDEGYPHLLPCSQELPAGPELLEHNPHIFTPCFFKVRFNVVL
jgi:hypothetical protein